MPSTSFSDGSGTGVVIADGFLGSTDSVAAITAIATADASDLATAIALANATKAKVNAILAALQA